MTAFFSQYEFAQPHYLWLLLALSLIWLRWRDQRWPTVILRTLVLTLVVLALADPQKTSRNTRTEGRLIAYDISASIPDSMRRWMSDQNTTAFSATKADRRILFGARTAESAAAETTQALLKRNTGEKTNIENLLSSALSLPNAPRNLFLFTDGWETEGSAERILPAAAAAGLRIYPILPTTRPELANVAVTKVITPTQGDSGESVNLKVALFNYNAVAVEGTLTVRRNGQPFKDESVKLAPGSQIIDFQSSLTEGKLNAFEAKFTAKQTELDRYPVDNQAIAWVSVRNKAKVLLLNETPGAGRYLEEVLKRQGFEVTAKNADNAIDPNGFQIVIFNNAPRQRFSPTYLAAVERHIANGNGFLMLGGEASFGLNAYRGTPIAGVLPVEPKEPPKKEEKNRAVVLLIDTSGSMREDNRITYAKEAAKAVARQLKDIDLMGVIGFDQEAYVVVYLENLSRLRGVVETQIDRLRPRGETYFLPALREAMRQLQRADATRKHVILLSDGVTRGSQGELVDTVTLMKNEFKITVSTVALSGEADVRIMKRLSQYGGGLFHHTIDPSSLPRIVLEQVQDRPKDDAPRDQVFYPVSGGASELVGSLGVRGYPAILGYMETEPKRGARQDIVVPNEDRRPPLLASWRYGRGKAVALTMDFESRWSRNWIQWAAMPSFWEKITDWLRPPQEEAVPAHEARVSQVGNQSLLELFAYEDASSASEFEYSVSGQSVKNRGTMKKIAVGHYQAVLPINTAGDYRIELYEDRQGRKIAYPPVGYTLPYNLTEEAPRPEFNMPLLNKLARETGGSINPGNPDLLREEHTTKSSQPLRNPLVILAAVLLFLEVSVRRLVLLDT